MTLAGIRSYAEVRGWCAEAFSSAESRREALPALLASRRPVAGCVFECSDDNVAPPSCFRNIPVVYLHASRTRFRGRAMLIPTDNEAVAEAAFRELSAGHPSAFAIVGHAGGYGWSKLREHAFAALAAKAKAVCSRFAWRKESPENRSRRLAAWVARLKRHTAIFAVNDVVAAEVAEAARAAIRFMPRELTLLGVDNRLDICEGSSPQISSIQIDFWRAGYVAAKMIGAQISAAPLARKTVRAERGMTTAANAPNDGRAVGANFNNSSLRAMPAPSFAALPQPSLPAGRAPSFGDDLAVASIGPLLAMRRRSTGGSGRREAFVMEAVEMIRREACDGLTAAALAKRFPCSRNLFDLRFREAVGRSALDEILHIRLEKACTLLAKTDTAVSAVPSLCGFRTHTALDRLFRSRFGLSMRDWRKKNA